MQKTRLFIQFAISLIILAIAAMPVVRDNKDVDFGALTTIAALWFPAPSVGGRDD
jgi:hypothetical protein